MRVAIYREFPWSRRVDATLDRSPICRRLNG
jgi:hypothetical protein